MKRETMVLKAKESVVEEFDWGKIYWFVSRKLGNSDKMTLGKCIIKPTCENPRHRHPNCEEVLHVLAGKIMHYVEDKYFEMGTGDTITIPSNLLHSAKNIGTEDAILIIAFSSADRQTDGE